MGYSKRTTLHIKNECKRKIEELKPKLSDVSVKAGNSMSSVIHFAIDQIHNQYYGNPEETFNAVAITQELHEIKVMVSKLVYYQELIWHSRKSVNQVVPIDGNKMCRDPFAEWVDSQDPMDDSLAG